MDERAAMFGLPFAAVPFAGFIGIAQAAQGLLTISMTAPTLSLTIQTPTLGIVASSPQVSITATG